MRSKVWMEKVQVYEKLLEMVKEKVESLWQRSFWDARVEKGVILARVKVIDEKNRGFGNIF